MSVGIGLLVESLDPGRRVYCSGYWPLPDNQKRQVGHYDAYLPLTIQMLEGSILHFYSSDHGVLERVRQLGLAHGIELLLVHMTRDLQYVHNMAIINT